MRWLLLVAAVVALVELVSQSARLRGAAGSDLRRAERPVTKADGGQQPCTAIRHALRSPVACAAATAIG